MIKKLGFLSIILLFLTGCTSYTELNDLSIVSTLGIDYQDDQYQLVVNVIDGKLEEDTVEKKILTFQSQNTSLEKAFHDIYLKSNKRLYLSHLDLLLITEDAINHKFPEIIHNFLENNEYRNNFHVVLLKDYPLSDFMQEGILAEDINHLIKTNQNETSFCTVKDFETMIQELLIDQNSYLPTISYQNKELILKGYTLIRNYQVYDELTLEESLLLNMLQNKVKKAYLNDASILESQTFLTTNQNHITFHFIIVINHDHHFVNNTQKKLISFLKKYQEQDYDILKLQETIRKNDYSYSKKVPNLLSKLTFDFQFELKEKENYIEGDLLYETK